MFSGSGSSSEEELVDTDDDGLSLSSNSSLEDETLFKTSKRRKQGRRKTIQKATNKSLENFEHIVFEFQDSLILKENHEDRPFWVTPRNLIYLERSSPFYSEAYEFLSMIGEPITRSELLHEWKLTRNSVHAASSIEMTSKGILEDLEKFSKVRIPIEVEELVKKCADSFGKVKIVLRKGELFIESPRIDLLQKLLKNSTIRNARVPIKTIDAITTINEEQVVNVEEAMKVAAKFEAQVVKELSEEEELQQKKINLTSTDTRQFQIRSELVQLVKKEALEMDLPLMEEFDYKQDETTSLITVSLKRDTEIRPYQQNCLSKMFGNSRAKSGVFVLPCGAGKTLTGIAAISTMKKSAMIVCNNSLAVEQWKRQFHQFADISDETVCRFTSKSKDKMKDEKDGGCVLITTYSMLSTKRRRRGNRSRGENIEEENDKTASQILFENLLSRDWGLLVLDEVHVAPAKLFRTVLTHVKAHCKLGLTATLVREDGLITDLSFLIGPKLYEANWMDLTESGFLARVECKEIRCPFTAEFMAEYLRDDRGLQFNLLLTALNPNKFRAVEYLLHYHEQLGDKILIFCDSIPALEFYSKTLNRPIIHGETPEKKRSDLFNQFRFSSAMNSLFVSKVGDMAIDLPEANVIVQISGHFGSRRQEAQRLGRILRAKPNTNPKTFNAHFYTLITMDTKEQYYGNRRQRYLIEQGYSFRVVDNILQIAQAAGLRTCGALRTIQDQKSLLAKLITMYDSKATLPEEDEKQTLLSTSTSSSITTSAANNSLPVAKRIERSSFAAVSLAAGSTVYSEFERIQKN